MSTSRGDRPRWLLVQPVTITHLVLQGSWLLPGVRVLGECGQAAGVHVATHINVHRCIGLGELSWQWDPLGSQGRHRRPSKRQPGHASSLLDLETGGNKSFSKIAVYSLYF